MFEKKKILFISPLFFDYHLKIIHILQEKGAIVDFYHDFISGKKTTKILSKINKRLIKKEVRNYYNNIIKEVSEKNFDYIFVIKGDWMTHDFLLMLDRKFANIPKILYLYDSVANCNGITEKKEFFDRTFSFDLQDCQKYGFEFRPLFYDMKYINIQKEIAKIDIAFIGNVHSDRLTILQAIKEKFPDKKYDYFLYLTSTYKYWFLKINNDIVGNMKKSDFHFKPLSSEEVLKKIANAKVIIDIEHPGQTGLTMRTIEMLGANKKLITTNNTVKEYDFYNPKNICIINRNNIEISEEFFKTEFQPLSAEILHKYSLTGFVEEIFTI